MPHDPMIRPAPAIKDAAPGKRLAALRDPQVAELRIGGGKLRLKARLQLTPAGILAIGGLVTGILLATSGIVWTATSVARDHPLATRLRRR